MLPKFVEVGIGFVASKPNSPVPSGITSASVPCDPIVFFNMIVISRYFLNASAAAGSIVCDLDFFLLRKLMVLRITTIRITTIMMMINVFIEYLFACYKLFLIVFIKFPVTFFISEYFSDFSLVGSFKYKALFISSIMV